MDIVIRVLEDEQEFFGSSPQKDAAAEVKTDCTVITGMVGWLWAEGLTSRGEGRQRGHQL